MRRIFPRTSLALIALAAFSALLAFSAVQSATIDTVPRQAAPDAIEAMLVEQKFAEALEACTRALERPGRRDLGQTCNQCGRALLGLNRPRDAAVMFARGAILYGDSAFTVPSLIELAIIYRDTFARPEVSHRLLNRAQKEEASRQRPDVLERLTSVRASLPEEPR